MPNAPELPLVSVDSEGTGIDLYHGARPYFFTSCDEDNNLVWLEWDVDPFTREPIVPDEDKRFIREYLRGKSRVLQNPGYDVRALSMLDPLLVWDWPNTYDTLLAGHLLCSNAPHDLTSMTLQYLGMRINQWEDSLEKVVKAAISVVKSKFPRWRRARRGLSEMPSIKEKFWKIDAWIPRALVKQAVTTLDFSFLPPDARQPTVVRANQGYDVAIGRPSKWGNPFVIGQDGTRREVVEKYANYAWNSPLIGDLDELYGKRIGCAGNCAPELCHGDVLRALCHTWMTALRDYGNTDSSVTLPLFKKQRALIQQRGLWDIYKERLKILPIVVDMENVGVTVNETRMNKLRDEFREEAEQAGNVCTNIAKTYDYDLQLPKAGNNKSLTTFVFDVMKLPVVSKTNKGKGANPSLDKVAMDQYQTVLKENSPELAFINSLRSKRKRDTAVNYMDSYERFWLPTKDEGWYVLHPSLNPTGTDTLRWSSANPNEQNISKQEGFNVRYCFGPPPGKEWWSLDYQNIELRIPAYLSNERTMIELFERPDDPPYFGSYHLMNASIVYPDLFWPLAEQKGAFKKKYNATWYQWIKNFGFAVSYGAMESSGTADRAAHKAGAQKLVMDKLKEHTKLNKACIDHAERWGFVETVLDKEVCPERGYPLYCSRTSSGRILPTVPLNYKIQGSACWVIMRAMIKVWQYLRRTKSEATIALQIHDELVIEAPAKPNYGNLPMIRDIVGIMESIGDCIGIPLTVGIEYHGENWSEGDSV